MMDILIDADHLIFKMGKQNHNTDKNPYMELYYRAKMHPTQPMYVKLARQGEDVENVIKMEKEHTAMKPDGL